MTTWPPSPRPPRQPRRSAAEASAGSRSQDPVPHVKPGLWNIGPRPHMRTDPAETRAHDGLARSAAEEHALRVQVRVICVLSALLRRAISGPQPEPVLQRGGGGQLRGGVVQPGRPGAAAGQPRRDVRGAASINRGAQNWMASSASRSVQQLPPRVVGWMAVTVRCRATGSNWSLTEGLRLWTCPAFPEPVLRGGDIRVASERVIWTCSAWSSNRYLH
jgi:hypothetical protein